MICWINWMLRSVRQVAKFYNLEPIVPVADWPDPFIRPGSGHDMTMLQVWFIKWVALW